MAPKKPILMGLEPEISNMLRRILIPCSLLLAIACGGSGSDPTLGLSPSRDAGGPAGSDGNTVGRAGTARTLVRSCLGSDLPDLTAVLDLLQRVLEEGAQQPEFEIDWLGGLTGGGIVPWKVDLDGDEVPDLEGTFHFTDDKGAVTIPFDLISLPGLNGSGLPDLLGLVRDNTTFHLSYALDDLLLESTLLGSGEGELDFEIEGGEVVGSSGEGTLSAGPCSLTFDYEEEGTGVLAPGDYPVADLSFELDTDGEKVTGRIVLDGTSVAEVHAQVPGEAEEVFRISLVDGRFID